MPVPASSVPCHSSQTALAEPALLVLLLWHAANAPPPSTCPRPTSTRCHWPADSQHPGTMGISAPRLQPGRGGPLHKPLLYTTGVLAFLLTPRSTFTPLSAPGSPGTNAKIGREWLGMLSQRYSHKHFPSFHLPRKIPLKILRYGKLFLSSAPQGLSASSWGETFTGGVVPLLTCN